jgi:type VI secretion system secreted protein Hcp
MSRKNLLHTAMRAVRRGASLGALIATTGLLCTASPGAGAATFLKLDGIEGESVAAGHAGEIELLSFGQSFNNDQNAPNTARSKAPCGTVTFTKGLDMASPVLLKKLVQGVHINTATFSFDVGGAQPSTYYRITLYEALVVDFKQTQADYTGAVVDSVVLKARRYDYRYWPQTGSGAPGDPVASGYDCVTTSVY